MRRFILVLLLVIAAPAFAQERIVINPEAHYPEGPLWHGGRLLYAEMGADRVRAWDGRKNSQVWKRPGCGPTSVADGGAGTLIVLCHLQNALARIDLNGATRAIIDRDDKGARFPTPNASINDARGGIYFSSSGTFSPLAPAEGSVLYLPAGENVPRRVASAIHYANGVALARDGRTLFVSEHLERRVLAYPVADDGSLGRRRVFVELDRVAPPGARGWEVGPDGLAVDSRGNLFIAEYGAGRVLVVDGKGALVATIPIPERYVTAPAFGPDEARVFVTAPSNNTTPPFVGKVYSIANPVFRKD
jgi:sugar lactone lactonase YvrE